MPAFSTIALIGLGGATIGLSLRERLNAARDREQRDPNRKPTNRSAAGKEIVGKAVPRGSVPPAGITAAPEAPPSTSQMASAGMASARMVGERARKRAAAGGMLLSAKQKGLPAVGGTYNAKTLLGL